MENQAEVDFITTLHQVEAEHQNNAVFLQDPYPATEPDEFFEKARSAQKLAQDLAIQEGRGLSLARDDLALGQEVVCYGTSHLRAALTAWMDGHSKEDYHHRWAWWNEGIQYEAWGLFAAIGIYTAHSTGGPYTHPLILEVSSMLKQRMAWCVANEDDGIGFDEGKYFAGIKQYLVVDDDDPTRIVDHYAEAWWKEGYDDDLGFLTYGLDTDKYLEVHRPQINLTSQDVRSLPYAASDMAEIRLMMKAYDDLHCTWESVTNTLREHDAELEKLKKLLLYWKDVQNQIWEWES